MNRKTVKQRMTRTDYKVLCQALLLYRYVNHRLTSNTGQHKYRNSGAPMNESCRRAARAMRVAGILGMADEYMRLVMDWPILTITVDEWKE